VYTSEEIARLEAVRSPGRLMIVANRLPVVLRKDDDDGWSSERGSGGLVSALMPVLRDRGGVWVGWPGVSDDAASIDEFLRRVSAEAGYSLRGVYLTEHEIEGFYKGFSNEIIWPLFHDLPVDCRFDPAHWRVYRQVNRKFAQKISEMRQPGDVIWVHDYHLIGVAAGLRQYGIANTTGFFLHIPFPPPDIFLKLPWRDEILSGLLEYDLVGFQTMRDCRNFQRCLRALYKVRIKGKGQVQELRATLLNNDIGNVATKRLRVGSFPISIDYDHHAKLAVSEAVSKELNTLAQTFGRRRVILSVDRLDYTKGLLAKLRAFRIALERYPELRENVVLSLHVVPSRESVRQYRRLRSELEQLISQINGAWSRPGWIPIHYYYHSLAAEKLSGYFRRADIMLVSPLKDGMNLVAKEYCASRPGEDGVLILSEFAGAAAELQNGALLINPYDDERTAARIYEAMTLPRKDVVRRMHALRQQIRHHDIFYWVESYLNAMAGRDLADFPRIADYVPGPPPIAEIVNA
jgi:alpha,alpha-trehalose-phosphate synthase [UDP-forming]